MNLTAPIIAAGCGATVLRAATWLAPLQSACDKYGIDTPARVAAFLAQIGVESGRLVWTAEIWGPTPAQAAYDPPSAKAKELGNTDPGDGSKYRGRGLIQITGKANYAICGLALNLPLIDHPELLEQPDHAAMSAAWYWGNRGLNALADAGQFQAITRAINGGLNGYSERLALYAAGKKALGLV
jgi:putative chitinase